MYSAKMQMDKWSFQKDVEYIPIKDIDFTSAKGKKRKLDESVGCTLPKNLFLPRIQLRSLPVMKITRLFTST